MTYNDININKYGSGIDISRNADGRLEVFVQGSDNHLWHIYQVKAGQDWSDWYDLRTHRNLPVGIQGIHVATNADGRLEVFVQGSDNHLWHIYQVKAGQDWSDWYDLRVLI